jgi:Lon protease-like protein
MPMFPLGSVLLPGMVLPLHVFEDRYRRLVDDVLAAAEPEFGVSLIERGSEVGGGDIRAMTACVARVVEAARTEDGRWALVAVGVRRARVREWLPDDPYPRAVLEDWPDEDGPVPGADRLDALESRVRRLVALATELGAGAAPADLDFSDDPGLRTFQLAVVAPVGAFDRLRVLREPGVADRTALLEELVAEQGELLEARLALGDDGFDLGGEGFGDRPGPGGGPDA